MSIGGIISLPPAAVIRRAVSSTSPDLRYTLHTVGMSMSGCFGAMPATVLPSLRAIA